jgi:hypothetical protein
MLVLHLHINHLVEPLNADCVGFEGGRKLGAHRAHRGPSAHPCVALADLLSRQALACVADFGSARLALLCRRGSRK